MSSDGQRREQAMEHDELMALHEANARQARNGPSPADQARLLDKVTESELELGREAEGLSNLKAKDFPLSNYSEADTYEYKWLQEIANIFDKARYPHPKSCLQGLSRAWAAGDSSEQKKALDLGEYARDEIFLMGAYSRAVRGEEGFQQETSAKQVTESHAIRDDGGSKKKGGLLGRWRS